MVPPCVFIVFFGTLNTGGHRKNNARFAPGSGKTPHHPLMLSAPSAVKRRKAQQFVSIQYDPADNVKTNFGWKA
jgi:hypothetical protein